MNLIKDYLAANPDVTAREMVEKIKDYYINNEVVPNGKSKPFTPFDLLAEISQKIPFSNTDRVLVIYSPEWGAYIHLFTPVPAENITVTTDVYNKKIAKLCNAHGMEYCVIDKILYQVNKGERMKFDVVVGNPPFHDGNRSDEANKLWPLFVKKAYDLSNNSGYVAMITPNGWMQPTADIGKGNSKNAISIFKDIFKKNNLIIANVDSDSIGRTHFKGVGSTFSYYVFQLKEYNGLTTLVTSTGEVLVDISKMDSLPKVVSKESLTIVKKMVGTPFRFCDQNHHYNGDESSVKTAHHIYRIYHTNKDGGTFWFGSKKNPFSNTPKVIISLSGKYLPTIDSANGFSNMCIALICSSDKEASNAKEVLSSKLYQFWVDMQKFSGFNPRKLILTLPAVDLTRAWTNEELYQHFGLTKEEIAYVESNVK